MIVLVVRVRIDVCWGDHRESGKGHWSVIVPVGHDMLDIGARGKIQFYT